MRERTENISDKSYQVRRVKRYMFSDVLAMYAPLVFSGLVDHQRFTCIFILHAKTNPRNGGKRRGSDASAGPCVEISFKFTLRAQILSMFSTRLLLRCQHPIVFFLLFCNLLEVFFSHFWGWRRVLTPVLISFSRCVAIFLEFPPIARHDVRLINQWERLTSC